MNIKITISAHFKRFLFHLISIYFNRKDRVLSYVKKRNGSHPSWWVGLGSLLRHMDQKLTPHEDVWLISCEHFSVLFSLMTTNALFWRSIRVADEWIHRFMISNMQNCIHNSRKSLYTRGSLKVRKLNISLRS